MVGIITVVRNEKSNLESFYRALLAQSYKNFSLYFVDSGSTDGSEELFRSLNSKQQIKVKYIRLDYNAGYAAGSNLGAKAAIDDGCNYLLILNNDAELDKNCLAELVKLAETVPNAACIGPLVFRNRTRFPGLIQEYGGKIDFHRGSVVKNFANKKVGEVSIPEIVESDFVGGCAMLVRSDVFAEAGMFEEAYFMYLDEIDFYYRLTRILTPGKHRIYVTSKAIVYHNHPLQAETKEKKRSYYIEYYLTERNKFLFFKKYGLASSIIFSVLTDLLKFPWRLLWFIKVCDFRLGIYYLRGIFAGLRGESGKPEFIA